MSGINTGRFILAGIAAAVLVNASETLLYTVVLGGAWDAATATLGLAEPTGAAMGIYALMGAVLGFVTVWLYVAIRPRFGPGLRTALIAGATAWTAWSLMNALNLTALGIVPPSLLFMAAAWTLVELCAAAALGGWIYREEPAAAAVHA